MKTVLVVEFNNFHAEIFPIYPTHCAALLGCDEDELSCVYAVSPKRYSTNVQPSNVQWHRLESSWSRWWASKLGIRRWYYGLITKKLLKRFQPDLVVFNTIESRAGRFLSALKACESHKTIIVVHSPFSHTYQLVKRSDNQEYFCLNHYNYQYLKRQSYPIDGYFMCAFPFIEGQRVRKTSAIQIAVLGKVEYERRDYNELIHILLAAKKQQVNNMEFIIVADKTSDEAIHLLDSMKKHDLMRYTVTFDKRPTDQEFAQAVIDCDYILPLLAEGSDYMNGKISGSIVHSGAYRKPMILKHAVRRHLNLSDNCCVGYDDADELIDTLLNSSIDEMKGSYASYINKQMIDCLFFLKNSRRDKE